MDNTRSDEDRLLRRLLDPVQAKEYAAKGTFCVQTTSGRRYLIEAGTVANIVEIDRRGRRCASWCIQTRAPVHTPSLQLAQFLLLSTDEETFRKIGNRTAFSDL